MGFCDKWLGWMAVCVFKGDVSVLVNRCPTEEIRLQKGLRQGDPLAAFLFLIVAEGLSMMMCRVVEVGKFSGFSFHQSLGISHLQYAEASYDNLDSKGNP